MAAQVLRHPVLDGTLGSSFSFFIALLQRVKL